MISRLVLASAFVVTSTSTALAEPRYGYRSVCDSVRTDRGAAGAAVGGIIGGVIGSEIASDDDAVGGIILGAALGAIVGNEIGKDSVECVDYRPYGHRPHPPAYASGQVIWQRPHPQDHYGDYYSQGRPTYAVDRTPSQGYGGPRPASDVRWYGEDPTGGYGEPQYTGPTEPYYGDDELAGGPVQLGPAPASGECQQAQRQTQLPNGELVIDVIRVCPGPNGEWVIDE